MWEFVKTWIAGDAAPETVSLHFAFDNPLGPGASLLLLASAAVVAGVLYWRRVRRTGSRIRGLLTALRVSTVGLALFLLLNPSLIGERQRTVDQVVAILFDDSKSMQIVGEDSLSRGDRMNALYASNSRSFESALRKRFHVARYGFGPRAERIDSPDRLRFEKTESDIVGAVEETLGDLSGADVAAVVLFSDGVQQPGATIDDVRLANVGAPVFTVGTGHDGLWRDVELADLSVKRTNFDKSPVLATLRVRAPGLDGDTVIAEVLEEGHLAAYKELTIDGASDSQTVQLEFIPTREGYVTYQARVRHARSGQSGKVVEAIAVPELDRFVQNNTRNFGIDNRKKAFRILYLAGSPSWENKFFRRALEEDEELKLTSLVRVARAERTFEFRGPNSSTANRLFQGVYQDMADQPRYDESVFLRLGADESELVSGYPSQANELFPYHLIIWGGIEHDFFSTSQLELTRAFVERRGGSLLLMGGPRSFAEGGFRGAIIDAMLPVVLRATVTGSRESASSEPFTAVPTAEGALSGAWDLDPNPDASRSLWEELVELHGLNTFTLTRPGASVMSRVDAANSDYDRQPFFAVQRYGAGQCAVMATGNTWPWHTHTPEDEPSNHQQLWRQIVRSLVMDVPEFTLLRNKADAYTVDRPIPMEILVRDPAFEPRDGLHTTAEFTTPAGDKHSLPVEESIQELGLYTSEYVPTQPGVYSLQFTASEDDGEIAGSIEEHFTVEPDYREFRDAQYDPAFLERIASDTGGAFVPPAQLSELAGRIGSLKHDAAEKDIVRVALWHWPPFLFLLVALLSAEWYIRRTRGEP